MPSVNTPAPPPAPPANSPQAPVFNATTGDSANGLAATAGQRRGANALRIDLAQPFSSGLAIPV